MAPFLFVITVWSDVVTGGSVGFCRQGQGNGSKMIPGNLTDFIGIEYVITRIEV